jgi:hypothetical protein
MSIARAQSRGRALPIRGTKTPGGLLSPLRREQELAVACSDLHGAPESLDNDRHRPIRRVSSLRQIRKSSQKLCVSHWMAKVQLFEGTK